jgi:hypothetical protein
MKRCSVCGVEKGLDQFWFSVAQSRHVAACNDCRRAKAKTYRESNKERTAVTNRQWQIANPDKIKAAHQRWLARNPGEAAKRTAKWRSENYERARESQRVHDRKLKEAAYAAYGGFQCACCGETTEAFLSIDHMNNDGAEHRRIVPHRKIYKWLARNGYPEGFQILCMNCNFGKARNGGVCPHESESLKVQRLSGNGVGPKRLRSEAQGSKQICLDEDIV